MAQAYLQYTFIVSPLDPGCEILIAELGEVGFESFVETEEGILAYIQQSDWSESILSNIQIMKAPGFDISYHSEIIEQVNWNEEWEKNFSPIEVSKTCVVRAPFHTSYEVPFEIIIEPKMSFGTGHHETTFMMLQFILEHDFSGKTVLDMGCGTAVLAILAEKRGASAIDAIDVDAWCVENSEENTARNDCKNIKVMLGDATKIASEGNYDTIIANINRNILLADMPVYVKSMKQEGELFLSGFYLEDLPQITQACNNLGLNFVEHKEKNNWIAAKFVN